MNAISPAPTAHHIERITAARDALAKARLESERAAALVEQAAALLSFEALATRSGFVDADVLAARVVLREVTLRDACECLDSLTGDRDVLVAQLAHVLAVDECIAHFDSVDWGELRDLIELCLRRGDRDGCLRLLARFGPDVRYWFSGDSRWVRELVQRWGRAALAPFFETLRGEELDILQRDDVWGTPVVCRLAAWALTQDDATRERHCRAVLSQFDGVCSMDLDGWRRFNDSRAAVVELLLSMGEVDAAVRLFESIAEVCAAASARTEPVECRSLQVLLPLLARALPPERLARVESFVFDRCISNAPPPDLNAWLSVLHSESRAKTLALLEAAPPQEIDTLPAALPPSVRAAVVSALLDQMRAEQSAPELAALIGARPALLKAIQCTKLELDAFSRHLSPAQRMFDLVVSVAQTGNSQAIDALSDWRAPNELPRPRGWFRGLPLSVVRTLLQRINETRTVSIGNHVSGRILGWGSAEAKRRWRAAVAETPHEVPLEFALPNPQEASSEDPYIAQAREKCERLDASGDWADVVGVARVLRDNPRARAVVRTLCDRWLDECESAASSLSEASEAAGEHLLAVASPSQLERASALLLVRRSALLTHGLLVGAVRAERDGGVDLRALRGRVGRAFEGVANGAWSRWVCARCSAATPPATVSDAPLEECAYQFEPRFRDECAVLGIVDDVLEESAKCSDDTLIWTHQRLLDLAGSEQRSRCVPKLLEVLDRTGRYASLICFIHSLSVDDIVERWTWLDRPTFRAVFESEVVLKLGGTAAVDGIGDKVIEHLTGLARLGQAAPG